MVGEPGMLQLMGLQGVRYDLANEQQLSWGVGRAQTLFSSLASPTTEGPVRANFADPLGSSRVSGTYPVIHGNNENIAFDFFSLSSLLYLITKSTEFHLLAMFLL